MLKHRTLLRRLWSRTPNRPERLIVRWIDNLADLKDIRQKSEQNASPPKPPTPDAEPRQS